jgi:hypothetical protein
MAKIMFDGHGILSGEWDSEAITRQLEAERKRDAKVQAKCAEIDTIVGHLLKDELAAEMRALQLTSRQKADFDEFKTHCAKLGLCPLPAPPQAVTAFLIERCMDGVQVLSRLRNSIATVHRTLNLEDPADDISVRALVRLARSEESNKPAPH